MSDKKILIKNGRVIDPANRKDGVFDVLIESGKVLKVAADIKDKADEIIDAKNKIVAPGLIDIHVHLREPGREDEETILTGARAAIKGGFTSIACMPNTTPPCDNQAAAKYIIDESKKNKLAKIYPIGCVTKKREGKELSEIAELKETGCVALSDDGDSVADAAIMRRALEYASAFDIPIISHCEDRSLCEGGVMNEGFISTVTGLKGMPNKAESIIIYRDIELAAMANARLHIAHVSTKEGVELIRQAKIKGVKVTCEATPHHIALTDACCRTYDTNTKVNPPLRTEEDVSALIKGLKDGTIDAIASDHAPHLESEKDVEYDFAPFGMIGLETSLAAAATILIGNNVLTWPELIEKMSVMPARIIGIDAGSLGEGKKADITIIDPSKDWVYEQSKIISKSRNTPFIGWRFKGMATDVIIGGNIVMKNGEL